MLLKSPKLNALILIKIVGKLKIQIIVFMFLMDHLCNICVKNQCSELLNYITVENRKFCNFLTRIIFILLGRPYGYYEDASRSDRYSTEQLW